MKITITFIVSPTYYFKYSLRPLIIYLQISLSRRTIFFCIKVISFTFPLSTTSIRSKVGLIIIYSESEIYSVFAFLRKEIIILQVDVLSLKSQIIYLVQKILKFISWIFKITHEAIYKVLNSTLFLNQ